MRDIFKYLKMGIFCTCISLFIIQSNIQAQSQRTITPRTNMHLDMLVDGYMESLPAGYNSNNNTYPLILFIHGSGQVGDGSNSQIGRVLNGGMMSLIANKTFPDLFTVGGKSFSFIVIAPQINRSNGFIPVDCANTVEAMINYAVSNYRVDLSRIYITGLSMGGGFCWYAAGRSVDFSKRLAGIVTMSGGASYEGWPQHIGMANLPMWSITNSGDNPYTTQASEWVNGANSAIPAPNPLARLTQFTDMGHESWTRASDPAFRDENGLNVYEWMLSHQRSQDGALPIALGNYTVTATNPAASSATKVTMAWTTTQEQNNSFFTVSRSTDGINFSSIATLQAGTQGQGNKYSFTDPSPSSGNSYYRLSQTDADGTTKNFEIKSVTIDNRISEDMSRVYPNPATDQIVLEINNNQTGRLNASIINAEGKVLSVKAFSKQTGFMREVFNIGSLAKGFYLLKVDGDNYLSTLRFIKE